MSGKLGDLSEKQEKALNEFKEKCYSLLTKPEHDDAMCLRFLRARNFDVKAAVAMYTNAYKYRQMYRVDTILEDWTPNPAMQKAFPGGVCGYDKEGSVVIISPMGSLIPKYFLSFCRPREVVKIMLWRFEMVAKLAREQSERLGKHIEAHTMIVDLEGMDVAAQLQSASGMAVMRDLTMVMEQLYPESMKYHITINAPAIFPVFFNLFKPFLNEVTLSKMKIFGKEPEKWKPFLLSIIDEDQLPVKYGGKKVGKNGEEDCSDEIVYVKEMNDTISKQLLELIPEEERVRTATISRRSYHEDVIKVTEVGCGLCFEFECDNNDIGFKLLLRDQDGFEEDLIDYKRHDCSSAAVLGCIRCDSVGEYVLHFDNSFSMLKSKKISYNVKVIPKDKFRDDMVMFHEP